MTIDAERFWSKVDKSQECWTWTGRLTTKGYGQIVLSDRRWAAHRWSYESLVGPIPEGLQIDHLCRNKACVNPDHLEPVTNKENSRRHYRAEGYDKTCTRGHPRTPENTYTNPNTGARHCRVCARLTFEASGYGAWICDICGKKLRGNKKKHFSTHEPKPPRPRRTHCPSGHPYSGDNLYISPDGGRLCKECGNQRKQRAKATLRVCESCGQSMRADSILRHQRYACVGARAGGAR